MQSFRAEPEQAAAPHLHARHHRHLGRLPDDWDFAGQARVQRLPLGAARGAAWEILLCLWQLAAIELQGHNSDASVSHQNGALDRTVLCVRAGMEHYD